MSVENGFEETLDRRKLKLIDVVAKSAMTPSFIVAEICAIVDVADPMELEVSEMIWGV